MLDKLEARAPEWALKAGLPPPEPGELFISYLERLGIDASEFLVELTDRTEELVHFRFEHILSQHLRPAWRSYIRECCRDTERTPTKTEILERRERPEPRV